MEEGQEKWKILRKGREDYYVITKCWNKKEWT